MTVKCSKRKRVVNERALGRQSEMIKIPDKDSLLSMVTEFEVDSCRRWRWSIRINRVLQQDGSHKWAVYLSRQEIWDRIAKDFIWDPMPSSRTKRYYKCTRFETFPEAWKQAQKAVQVIRSRYAEEDALIDSKKCGHTIDENISLKLWS